LLQHLIW
jgi:hypothetical protein